jgi:hypothetical protein
MAVIHLHVTRKQGSKYDESFLFCLVAPSVSKLIGVPPTAVSEHHQREGFGPATIDILSLSPPGDRVRAGDV